MERRRLGRTGHDSSVVVLGGAAFWGTTPEQTAEAFDAALAAGVNHLDVAPQYGRAQELLGPLIPPVRDRLFVACKTLLHDRAGLRAQLEETDRKIAAMQSFRDEIVRNIAKFELFLKHGHPGKGR